MYSVDLDRVLGVIYGQCVGDALGLPAEFKSANAINTLWPSDLWPDTFYGTQRRGTSNWAPGEWSDDSEQALCILDAYLYGGEAVNQIDLQEVARRFLHWSATDGRGMGSHTAKVFAHPLFVTDPRAAALDVWEQSGQKSAPNGAVMRTSYVGILRPWDIAWTASTAVLVAGTTHADPRCLASAAAVSVAIATLVSGGSFEEAITQALAHATQLDSGVEQFITPAGLQSLNLDEGLDGPRGTTFPPIGYTYKCLGAGFWALRRAHANANQLNPRENFHNTVREVIRAGGDADTNGAVAGAMLGAYLGFEGIPTHFVEGLHSRSSLDARAKALCTMHNASMERSSRDT